MKKGIVLVAILTVALLVNSQALAGFQESRWQIIENLANPSRDDFDVNKASWERTDLRDGTPRWMNDVRGKYVYELLGSPIHKATLLGELGGTEQSGWELGCRIINLIEAVGLSATKAQEVSQTLFNATVADPGAKYYVDSGKIRVELVYYESMGSFMLIVTKKS